MINITDKKDCCGCTACASICPHSAIEMKPDVLGFMYPQVDKNKCIDCGLCDRVCAFNENYDKSLNLSEPIAYAVRHKKMTEIIKSQSGAAFVAVSDWILENGGVVYGAGYKGHFIVTHKRATTKDERDEFRGSKYVQSDLTDVFKQVKNDLKNGLTVMFSGTPCQTSGLNSFVGKTLRKNLYLVDIVCHGVPGPFMWRDYLKYLEKKYHKKIVKVNFRDKTFGWKSYKETFLFNGSPNKVVSTKYTFLFYKHFALRLSCGNCFFANLIRPSDITIADYWGYERTDPKFGEDDRGCSLMINNTIKGKELFESVRDRMNFVATKLKNIMQPNLEQPSALPPQRLDFEKYYEIHGFEKCLKKYGTIPIYLRIRNFARKCRRLALRIFGFKKI